MTERKRKARQTDQAAGFGPAGERLWHSVADVYELEEHEAVLLRQACVTVDTIEELQTRLDAADVLDERYSGRVHPCLPELRAQRLALARLLKSLDVGDAADVEQPKRQRRRWPNGAYGTGKSLGVVS